MSQRNRHRYQQTSMNMSLLHSVGAPPMLITIFAARGGACSLSAQLWRTASVSVLFLMCTKLSTLLTEVYLSIFIIFDRTVVMMAVRSLSPGRQILSRHRADTFHKHTHPRTSEQPHNCISWCELVLTGCNARNGVSVSGRSRK